MKEVSKKLILLITIFVMNSCASNSNKEIIDNYRELSSKESGSCGELVKEIVSNVFQKNKVKGKKYSEIGEIFTKRKEIEDAYSSFSDSVKDIKLHPDLPVETTAKLIIDPHEALLAKVLLIKKAKKTIDLTYYIFDKSESAKIIFHEIRLAVKRGVKVRIMYDQMGSFLRDITNHDLKSLMALKGKEITDQLGQPTGEFAGVEAVAFNPVINIRAAITNWYRKIYNLIAKEDNKKILVDYGWNHRSHDKILLIDAYSPEDSVAIVGGRNISDNYFHIYEGNEDPITDTEFIVKGLSQKDESGNVRNLIEEHYNRIFFYMANANLKNHLTKINNSIARDEFKAMRNAARNTYGEGGILKDKIDQMLKENYLEKDFENSLVEIVNEVQNLTRKKIFKNPKDHEYIKNGNSILTKIFKEISNAKKTIDIVTPYFWITDEEIDLFIKWLAENPERKIRIASNSIFTNDLLPAQALIEVSYKKIMEKIKGTPFEKQIELYNFGKIDQAGVGGNVKYGFLHAKVYMFDENSMILSTSNIDPISRHINSEIGAAIKFTDIESKNTEKMKQFVKSVIDRSTLKGSFEDEELHKHPAGRTRYILLKFISEIIFRLNLVPIL